MIKSKKQLHILEASKKLFYKYGIKKVTIEEICKDANVSKMTFYKYYPNKNELVKGMLTFLFENGIKQFRDLMESDIPFSEKLAKMLELKIESTRDISMEFLMNVYHSSDEELAAFLKEYYTKTIQDVMDEFIKAQEKGWMRKDINPALLLIFIDKIKEITSDKRILMAYRNNAGQLVYEINKFFMYGLSGGE